MTESRLQTSAFQFELPQDRIAQRPRPYSEQKLLVFDRHTANIEHILFQQIQKYLRPGDMLVMNDTKVVPAALRRMDGSFVLFTNVMATSFSDLEVICPFKPKVGEVLEFPSVRARITLKSHQPGWDVYVADLICDEKFDSLMDFLEVYGDHPIPTYIFRSPDEDDKKQYQNIYAKNRGSIACPVAGLHFNQELLDKLASYGVETQYVTLHVGYGTFRSFKTSYVDEHKADAEKFNISISTLHAIGRAKSEKRRIIAVGSTVARLLESIPSEITNFNDLEGDLEGETDLFIYPPFEFKVISGLITNLPYPKIPVMSMAAAVTGLENLRLIIEAALKNDYLFYSYGDAILALI